MKTKFFWRFFLASFVFLASAGISQAQSLPSYEILDLGSLSGYYSRSYGINDARMVGGRLNSLSDSSLFEAMYWDSATGMKILQSLGGNSRVMHINNSGQMFGVSNNRAVVWNSHNSAPLDLGTFGGPTSFAFGGDDQGRIVGWADMPEYSGYTVYHAFLYQDGSMQDLGTLANWGGAYWNGYSLAYDINPGGKVVGVASTNDYGFHAFSWDSVSGMRDLGTHPNHPEYEGYAAVINDSGSLIAGNAIDASSNSYLMIWKNGSLSPQLVSPHPLFPYGEFYGVNRGDIFVGVMWDDVQKEHAFLYTEENGLVDLNNLVGSLSGWELNYAVDINENNEIAGWGTLDGVKRAFVLSPRETDTSAPASPVGLLVK